MIQQRKNISFIVATLLIASFFGLSVMGSQLTMGASSEKMIGCPYAMDSMGICPMSFNEHLLRWMSLFSAVTPEISPFFLALVSFTVFCAFFLYVTIALFRNRFRIASSRGDPLARTYMELVNAMRIGLIHPKLYA